MDTRKLAFLGAGNMAESMCRGILKAGLYPAAAIIAADIAEPRRRLFQEQLGVRAVADAVEALDACDVAVLAVKPQQLADLLALAGPRLRPGHLLVSIVAGAPTRRIEDACPGRPRVVRVMPNTPMLVGRGMSAVSGGRFATADDVRAAVDICRAAGDAIVVDEPLMDAVTAVSGSGPAYFFFLVERLIEAGVAEGLTPEAAGRLARQTALGAAEMMLAAGDPPEELRRRVTSPGGTTEAAFRVLAERGVPEAFVAAVRRAAERSRELGRR
jgi:pyrroline-5-carboxylate reductase